MTYCHTAFFLFNFKLVSYYSRLFWALSFPKTAIKQPCSLSAWVLDFHFLHSYFSVILISLLALRNCSEIFFSTNVFPCFPVQLWLLFSLKQFITWHFTELMVGKESSCLCSLYQFFFLSHPLTYCSVSIISFV